MRFILTFVWSFLLVSMLNYVVGSIAEAPFSLGTGAIVSAILAIFVIVIGESFPDEPVSEHK